MSDLSQQSCSGCAADAWILKPTECSPRHTAGKQLRPRRTEGHHRLHCELPRVLQSFCEVKRHAEVAIAVLKPIYDWFSSGRDYPISEGPNQR